MRFLALDKLINLRDGYRKRFKIDALDLILTQEGTQIYAFGAICPHQEQSLESVLIEAGVAFCPRHNFGFSLETGEHVAGLCQALPVFTVHFEGNAVGVLLES